MSRTTAFTFYKDDMTKAFLVWLFYNAKSKSFDVRKVLKTNPQKTITMYLESCIMIVRIHEELGKCLNAGYVKMPEHPNAEGYPDWVSFMDHKAMFERHWKTYELTEIGKTICQLSIL